VKSATYGTSTHITWATGYLLFAFEARVIPKGVLDLMNSIATISLINFETKEISGRLKVDFMVSVSRDYERRPEQNKGNMRRGKK
jgi:hypothetical protein